MAVTGRPGVRGIGFRSGARDCHAADDHHAPNYLWGIISIRRLYIASLGLERAELVACAFFFGTWIVELDADCGSCVDWTATGAAKRKARGSVSRGGGNFVLLRDCQLSVLGWFGLLWEPIFHFAHTDICVRTGAFVRTLRPVFP